MVLKVPSKEFPLETNYKSKGGKMHPRKDIQLKHLNKIT